LKTENRGGAREGAGRPLKYGTKYVAQKVQFVVSVANNAWLAREARRLGISKSELLNRLIEEQRL
tara:strand:+ start:575 stop:769 length:195 start_codon:yes stop_codon:yes gene_type:complete